ncbi:universal stress protein UspA-like protein [filamentous cyanobacterium CCT1]|nr:universal stress protein UspA-like protein [filamentous cyanobacterium CCT1]
MFQRALVCTDFTDGLYRLAQFVPSLASGGFKQIVFCHHVSVEGDWEIPPTESDEVNEARQRFENLLREVPEHVEVAIEVMMGRPSDNILRLVKKYNSQVVFLGSPTRTLLEEKLFGSTSARLAEQTPVPLMILRPQLVSTYTTKELDLRFQNLFEYLLIPYDGSEGSDYLLDQIKQAVKRNPEAKLERCRLLWVIDDGVRPELRGDAPFEEAQTKLQAVQASLSKLNLVVNTSVVEGNPLEEILKAAETHDISAIATCSRGIGGFLRWSIPSLTREILRHSWHPVLFYPPKSQLE